jgi:hypothetical protein
MRWTPARQAKFLEFLSNWGNVTRAALAVDTNRTYIYELRDRVEGFAHLMDEAIMGSREVLEAEAWRRANEGVDEPVVSMGKVVMVAEDGVMKPLMVNKYSDSLMQMLLRGHYPEKYKDRQSVDLNQKGGPSTTINILAVARDRLSHELDVVAQRLASGAAGSVIEGGPGGVPSEADGRRNISAAERLAGLLGEKESDRS